MTDDLSIDAATIESLRQTCGDLREMCRGFREINRALVAENEALRARVGTQLTRIGALETLRQDAENTIDALQSELERMPR